MTTEEFKTNIQEALQAFSKGNLTKNSLDLFGKLGYITERRAPLDKPTFDEFQDTYISDQRFDETKARVKEWKYVDLLFQLSREEISQQASLFDTKQVDKTIIETYLFFAIELTGDEYNRTDLSNITRKINRLFPMPVMVLFKYGNKLTFSVIDRRLHKRDESKDVLEKVTLIKDISIESPLRAHIEILFDLSFQELLNKHQFTNFVELHNAWQKTLDTKELNKRFYSELFNWYLWAVQTVRFPNDLNDDKDNNVYNAESVIRLLTRLIFVWFIKEKNLVPETLFNLKKLKTILKDFKPESEKTSVYYRAILQNLFFATLNTPMDKDITDENKDEKRRFINTLPKTGNDQYLDQTKYRYQEYFINPDKALELFATIPFLNGGLFECLDFKEGNKEIRFDGFSSTEKRQAFVPDNLFFADEFVLDLNAEYGTKGKKYKVEGLINILDSYKFTIAENTPLEEEIALDPELLGKVFENLLASYNPETQTTARKQTGSFYTPREIVNYMVDESLIAYFKQKLDNSDDVETRFRDLFAHTTVLPEFSITENIALIKAISEAKILDPACGSGAFPMGVLHRLVDLLNKLDPNNKHWNELQKQRAIAETAEVFDSGDTEERKIRLDEINKAFDLSMNYPDYARKLFLIENCIYGVDIQQIAIQISKLRFFISLIVDQKVNDSKPNRNILSMPNLETKFVAANTLIGLDKPQQMTLMAGDVERLEKELASLRHKIFFTRKYSAKKVLKKKEKEKREELQTALTQSGFSKNVAGQISGWNPFDPMQSAKFFDPETMFGFNGGFDVVIGNPPYVSYYSNTGSSLTEAEKKYFVNNYKSVIKANDRINSMNLMTEKGLSLLKANGHISFITNKTIAVLPSYLEVRKFILSNSIFLYFVTDLDPFEAIVDCVVFGLNKTKLNDYELKWYKGGIDNYEIKNAAPFYSNAKHEIHFSSHQSIISKIESAKHRLEDLITINRGVNIGGCFDDFLCKTKKSNSYWKYLGGTRNINRYSFKWLEEDGYMKFDLKREQELRNQGATLVLGNHDRYKQERLLIPESGQYIMAAYCNEDLYSAYGIMVGTSCNSKYSIKYSCALLNSKLLTFYAIEKEILRKGKKATPHVGVKGLNSIPIHFIEKSVEKSFVTLVDKIISAKNKDFSADTSEFEKEIDELVYKLYGISNKEIKIIEGDE